MTADFDCLGAAVRIAYREACHGAGADARWVARDELDRLAADADPEGDDVVRTANLLRRYGLDLGAYFASRPISRPRS